ncbi:HlyU family transcriptional regulator [Vibrio cidicii]|uniref:HlyU family transcriptional regulator n=1 Tax=Vibrio cidicii TaxID=1763883 RepID=UPI003F513889
MGLFSRLFGLKTKPVEQLQVEAVEYKGYLIYPDSKAEGGQFRVSGRITKENEGVLKTHQFIRSDLLSSESDANELMIKKSQMFIDQMKDDIFN